MALDEDLELPRDLGPYTLLKRLAVGGMAEVYVAKTKGLGGFEKQVAVKVIHPRYSEDEHFVQMLVGEAKIAVLLTHVNIAQTFDLGRHGDQYYIVMEYIEGADAYRVMRKCAEQKRAMPIDVAAFIVAEMCSGLDYAHRKRAPDGEHLAIVHRDISPQNVLISFSGEVKLVDFGIAKAASRSEQTEAGVIKGKYYYMSPEQAWGDPMDHRSDIFSTGVVLYELLTGRMLYTEENVVALLDKVRKADIAPPEKRRPSIPKALSDIVMKALHKNADDRYQSAQELGQALSGFLYTASPTFSAARLGELMGQLYPELAQRHSSQGSLVPPPREPTPIPSPAPPAKGADMAGWDEEEDDETRHDVLPFRRLSRAADEAAKREATAEAAAPPAPVAAMRPPGRDPRLATAPVEAPAKVRATAEEAPTNLSAPKAPQWEDPTRLRGHDEEFDDSTMVDATGQIRELRNQLRVPEAKAPPSSDMKVVESGRGRVHVGAPTRAAPRAPAKPASVPPPPRAGAWGASPQLPPSRPLAPVVPRVPTTPQQPAPRPVGPPAPTVTTPTPTPPAERTRGEERAPTRPLAAPQAAIAPPTAIVHAVDDLPDRADSTGPVGPVPAAWPPAVSTGSSCGSPGGPFVVPTAPQSRDPFAPPPPAVSTMGVRAQEDLGRPQPGRIILGFVIVLCLAVAAALGVAWAIRTETPPAALVIATTPPGATVVLDGTALPGTTPLMISAGLNEGQSYALEVRLAGHSTWTATFVASPGTTTHEITLTPASARLHIDTVPPGAAISIGGAALGTSPLDVPSLFMGQALTIRATLAGFDPSVATVVLSEAEQHLTLTLSPAH